LDVLRLYPVKSKALSVQSAREGVSMKESRPTIALLIHSISDPYGTRLWIEAMDAAMKAGANLICFPGWSIHDQRGFNAKANVIYDLMNKEVVDGIIISGTLANTVDKAGLQSFCEQYRFLPMVSIAVKLEGIPSVLVENRGGMLELVTHLIEVDGIRKLAFVSGPEGNEEARARKQGFMDALGEHGLEPIFVTPPYEWDDVYGVTAVNALLNEQGLKLGKDKDIQAVVTGNDNVAFGALSELRKHGIRVPEDVVVTGFDDQERSRYLTPPLTTVFQPIDQQAREAVRIVLSQLRGERVDDEVILGTRLVVRQSCGCLHPVIKQRKAEIVTRPEGTIRIALAASREIVQLELEGILTGTSDKVPKGLVDKLVAAFYSELEENHPGDFLATLDEVLRELSLVDCNASVWQKALAVMREQILPCVGDDSILFRAEDLWQYAHMMIGESMQRAQAYHRMEVEKRAAVLDGISQELISTSDEGELMNTLAEELPKLDIRNCFVSRYENPAMPSGCCENILTYKEGRRVEVEKDQRCFPGWQLAPSGMLPQDRSYSLVIEPLYFRENQIGIAVFETGPRDGTIYETLRGQLSSALWGSRLVGYLKSLYKASSTVISLKEPDSILKDIVEQARIAVGAKGANIVLVDKEGQPQRLVIGSDHKYLLGTSALISDRIVLIDNLQGQESSIYQQMYQDGAEAAGCFPLSLRGRPIGSLWIFYEKPHHFPDAEVEALRLYANQVAIAYDNARRMKELDHLRQAAEKLTSVAEVREVLQQIVRSAREVLQADSAVIWSYNTARHAFLPDELVADGVDTLTLETYRRDSPRLNGTAALVMKMGYLPVPDVEKPEYPELKAPTHRLRSAIHVKSFQGVVLQVEDEPLGVLYVNYQKLRGFDEEDKITLKTLAYDAALALKKARLLDRLQKVHDAARIVATESVLNKDLQSIMNAIAIGTKKALECDIVTLYSYDQANCIVGFPPAMAGVKNENEVLKFGYVAKSSLIYQILEQGKLYAVEDVSKDSLVKGPFVARENVKSSVSIPLVAGDRKVGVMFVNHCTPYHFTEEELDDIELFAHQAAVAIRNAQLFNETIIKTAYLQAQYEAGKAVSSTLALDNIIDRIVEQIRPITGCDGRPAHLVHVARREGSKLIFREWLLEPRPIRKGRTGIIDLEGDAPIGVMGRAVRTGQSQLVEDTGKDLDYIKFAEDTHSELAVPIKIGEVVEGVINVEHSEYKAFTKEDQGALEALTAQAGLAIQNARMYAELEQRYDELRQIKGFVGAHTALEWMRMVSAVWGHSIKREVGNTLVSAGRMKQAFRNEDYSKALEELGVLETTVEGIGKIPITAPLSIEDAVSSVSVNDLIQGYLQIRWKHASYKLVDLKTDLQTTLDGQVTVRTSKEWLRRGLEIVVENAVQAMLDMNSHPKCLLVTTRLVDNMVKIIISDTGPGIPKEILGRIKKGEPIENQKAVEEQVSGWRWRRISSMPTWAA
jgi:GAF domain-containing protein/DNA-binding LacI/PurR family transcriptional regulator